MTKKRFSSSLFSWPPAPQRKFATRDPFRGSELFLAHASAGVAPQAPEIAFAVQKDYLLHASVEPPACTGDGNENGSGKAK